MNTGNKQFVKSYVELITILSSKYSIYVIDGVLFGKNKNTNQIFKLAERPRQQRHFVVVENINGHALLDYICQEFNNQKNLNLIELDVLFEKFVLKNISHIAYPKKYNSM